MKKIISLLLVVIIMSVCTMGAFAESVQDVSTAGEIPSDEPGGGVLEVVNFEGEAGENATWKFDPETVTLTFSGTGRLNTTIPGVVSRMYGVDDYTVLPYEFDENFYMMLPIGKLKVVLEEGIIGFEDGLGMMETEKPCLYFATSYQFPKTLEDLPAAAFMYNGHVDEIRFAEGIKAIPEFAFYNCPCDNTYIPKSVTSLPIDAFFCASMDGEVESDLVIHYAGTEEEWNKIDFTCPGKVQEIDDETLAQCKEDFSHYNVVFEPAADPIIDNEDVTVSGEINGNTVKIEEIKLKNTEEKSDVVLDFSSKKDVTSVEFSPEALNSAVENVKDGLVVCLPAADVGMDSKVLGVIAEAGIESGATLSADKIGKDKLNDKQNAALYGRTFKELLELELEANGKKMHDFDGGNVSVSIHSLTGNENTKDNYSVYYLDENGKLIRQTSKYENGMYIFTITHFSTFVVLYEGAPENPETGDNVTVLSAIVLCTFLAVAAAVIEDKRTSRF